MEYTALWGPKGFIVSPSKIVPVLNLSTSFSVKTDKGNDTSGTSTTNDRGRELQSLSLSTLYVRGAGVDPIGQIAEWQELVGQSYPLYIEGQRFGPDKLKLKSVDVSEILLSNTGKFLQCAVSLKFEEYSAEAAANAAAVTASSTKAAATYNTITAQKKEPKTEQKKQALKTTAKASDKAVKKPTVKAVIYK